MSDPHSNHADAVSLQGRVVVSDMNPEVSYELERVLGQGGLATVHYALRRSPTGTAPAAVKIIHAQYGNDVGSIGYTSLTKEVVALKRLDEQAPRTPFVVRLLDVGVIDEQPGSRGAPSLWLALEHVFGGLEGTTLQQRVRHSLKYSGHAFDPIRSLAISHALSKGLSAVHELGIIHRDLKPGNILCCGHGSAELFKIADFGIARASGMEATFESAGFGTPGYAAPEQLFPEDATLGVWSDVFSTAATMFFVLTGEHYFDAKNSAQALQAALSDSRRDLQSCRYLHPALRESREACSAIDTAIALATTADHAKRLGSVSQLMASLRNALEDAVPGSAGLATVTQEFVELDQHSQAEMSWTVRHPPGDDRVIHQVAWSGDGNAMAATGAALDYWNGTSWQTLASNPVTARALAVCNVKPGLWLLAGASGRASIYSTGGDDRLLSRCPQLLPFTHCSGDPDDIALFVAEPEGAAPLLVGMASGRWMKPHEVAEVATVNSLCRLDDQTWLICGRTTSNTGFAAIYEPMQRELTHLVEAKQALLSCAGDGTGVWAVLGGKGGETYRLRAGRIDLTAAAGASLTCTSVDRLGKSWAGSAGRIFESSEATEGRWVTAWENRAWQTPFRSLRGDLGHVLAMTVDGGVLEGRRDIDGP